MIQDRLSCQFQKSSSPSPSSPSPYSLSSSSSSSPSPSPSPSSSSQSSSPSSSTFKLLIYEYISPGTASFWSASISMSSCAQLIPSVKFNLESLLIAYFNICNFSINAGLIRCRR